LTSLEFRNFKGTTMWLEEEVEDLVCDVTCAIVTLILRVSELIVVTNSEDLINRLTNRNPRVSN
jgi:hypothetical protein